MADDSGSQGPASDGQSDGASAAAVSIALAAAANNERVAGKAETFFDKQNGAVCI
jgi:hypothetical protein